MKEYHFEIWQGGVEVVAGSGTNLEQVKSMMVQYATQYVQDGPIKITGSPELAPDNRSQIVAEKTDGWMVWKTRRGPRHKVAARPC